MSDFDDIVVRGFKYDEVSFELGQKYMNGTMTGRDILQDIEKTYGSVGVWWGTVGSSADDFYGSPEDARNYAGWSGDGSIEHRWQDMLGLTGGVPDPSEWMDAEIRVVLVAKKPMRDYGTWNPTTENGEGSMWESTSFFGHGERLELVEIQYAADRSGNDWKSEAVGGLTVTAANLPPGLRMENPKPNQVVAYDDGNPDPWLSRFGVAVLSWDDDGIISWVAIQDDSYKRRGIATAMLEYARTIRPDIRHSDELSESGAGWAQAVGFRTAGTRTDPGGVYRGINVQVLSYDEQEEVAAWANGNSFSIDNYQLAEPNYELVYRILDRLDSGGLGRHWSKDYDVSADFARDQGDGIELILIGHWEGEGVDQREFHRGWDGVQRPSNLPHEEEVTLYPGTPVTLVGMDIVTETGFTYNIPVPNIQVTAGHDMKHLANRTAAEPGGVLPWVPSDNGYYWITKNDDSMEAVTNDGINRMRLYEKPWGWEWVVRDSHGVVEKGNFGSGMAPDALRDRADDLLSEFDTNPLRRTRGPSRDYQDDYTQAPNELWGRRKTTSQRYAERLRREGRR